MTSKHKLSSPCQAKYCHHLAVKSNQHVALAFSFHFCQIAVRLGRYQLNPTLSAAESAGSGDIIKNHNEHRDVMVASAMVV